MKINEKVYEYLRMIPKGRVVTYGQIAEYLGNPKLARVVGNILHVNPDPDRNPCFRVVNASGRLSANFGCGGIEEQKRRLEDDGIEVTDWHVDLGKYRWNDKNAALTLEILPQKFSVCQVSSISTDDLASDFTFFAKTDEELSLVCPIENVPENTSAREDGWRVFRITGVLDFSLIGILAGISSLLAEAGVGIFAISTYNTDYILVKEENIPPAEAALKNAGYNMVRSEV